MKIKVIDNPIPTGYMNLEDCIKSWGDKGRSIYDGLIRQSMQFHGISNKDIHTPPVTKITVDVIVDKVRTPFEWKEKYGI